MGRRYCGDEEAQIEELEFERDAITGRKAKRHKMAALNNTKLSTAEMDDIFLDTGEEVDFD